MIRKSDGIWALAWLMLLGVLGSCSVTKNLPEGELLYIGQKPMVVNQGDSLTETGASALTEIEAALASAPNNSFMGSSTMRTPFPVGLWIYNAYAKSRSGFGKWMFDHFAATPVLLSAVNPDIRVQAANNILHENGYFRGKVSHAEFRHPKDSLQVRLQYTVEMNQPYFIDTVIYSGFSSSTMRLLQRSRRRSEIARGSQFNVVALDNERNRLSDLLRNVGYYYFRPGYMTYQADTARVPGGGRVSLRLVPAEGMPPAAEKPFVLGRSAVNILGRNGESPNAMVVYSDLDIHYYDASGRGKPSVRPNMLHRWLDYRSFRRKRQMTDSTGLGARTLQNRYSLHRANRIQERLSNLGIFRYQDMRYVPRDSALVGDTLDMVLDLMLDKPYQVEADFNVKIRSNNQTGPGASLLLTRSNVFGGGESWSVKLNGSYEWQTGRGSSSAMNSYEIGVSSALTFPRVLFPYMGKREYDFPATTTLQIYANQLNRPKYYRMLALGGNATYDFQPSPYLKHSFTPFRLTYNMLSHETDDFRKLQEQNPALYVSLRDQLIPAMEYTFTFDNASRRGAKHSIWWQTSIAESGNVASLISKMGGEPLSKPGKKFMGVPYSQFLKLNTELRYHRTLAEGHVLAARVAAGVVWSYGNASAAPYTEQFYIGGANSVRAFSARNVGPGGLRPDENNKYSFINHVGDLRFEANVEYRFRMIGDLHGALFLDSGNVWLLRNDPSRPDAQFRPSRFLRQLALGTGLGLRYDMDFLVFRLDAGVGIHDPYETGKKGYYNIPSFKDGLALHFAIGYPF